MSRQLVHQVLEGLKELGVKDISLCPSSRNAFFVQELAKIQDFNVISWYEERSAAFYALGKIKRTRKPAAVITTSGTAAAEILPAAIEAHYLGLPLILITADRPVRYRMTGAPQAAEQVGLFSHYAHLEENIVEGQPLVFTKHKKLTGPLHLNVCLEDPFGSGSVDPNTPASWSISDLMGNTDKVTQFLDNSSFPFIIVSGLSEAERTPVAQFLQAIEAPVYLEASSGLRECPELERLSIRAIGHVWTQAQQAGYPIDAVLRIGGVPTLRAWRDLDENEGKIALLSVSSAPFPGASWSECLVGDLALLGKVMIKKAPSSFENWKKADNLKLQHRIKGYEQFPRAEPALIYSISQVIDSKSLVYTGNSLPIREWDLAASYQHPHPHIACNRGVNGIDGQLSTFFGMCDEKTTAWGIFGDLTTLYDLAGPWALLQNKTINPICVVINNGGGKIFERMYRDKNFLNLHTLNFAPIAQFWGMDYCLWETIPLHLPEGLGKRPFLIEVIPDSDQTEAFWSYDKV